MARRKSPVGRTVNKYSFIDGKLVDGNTIKRLPDDITGRPVGGLGDWTMGLPRERTAVSVNPNVLMANDLANNATPLPPSAREGFARIYQLGVQSGAGLDTPLDLKQFGLLFPQTQREYNKMLKGITDPYLRSLAGTLRDVNPQALPTTFGGLKQALMGSYYPEALTYANSLKSVRRSAGDVVGDLFAGFDDLVTEWDPKAGGFFNFMQSGMADTVHMAGRNPNEISAIPMSVFDGPQNGAEEELFAFQQSGVDDMAETLHLVENSLKGMYGGDYAAKVDLALEAYYEEVMGIRPTGENWKQDLRREVIRRGYEGGYGMDEVVSGLENVEKPASVPWYQQLSDQLHPERGSGASVPSPFYVPKGQSLWVPNEQGGLTFSGAATVNKPLVQGFLRTPKEVQQAVSVINQYRTAGHLPEGVRQLDESLREAWLYRNNPALANAGPEEYAQLLPAEMRNPSNFPLGWRQQLIGQVKVEDTWITKSGKTAGGRFNGIPVNLLVPNVQNEKTGVWRGQSVLVKGSDNRLQVNPNFRTEDTHEVAYVTGQELSMYGETLEEVRDLRKLAKQAQADGETRFAQDLRDEADRLVDPEKASIFRKGMKTTSTGIAGRETVGGNVLGNMGVFENAISHGKYDAEPRQFSFDEIRAMRDKALKGMKDPIAVEMINQRYNNMMKAAGGDKVWDIDDVPEKVGISDADLAKVQELHAKEVARVSQMSPLDRMANAIERNTGTAQVAPHGPRKREQETWLGADKPAAKPYPVDMGRQRDEYEERDITWNDLQKPTVNAPDDKASLVMEPKPDPAVTHLDQLKSLGRPLSVAEIRRAKMADARGWTVYGPADVVRAEPAPRRSEDKVVADTVNRLTEWDPSAQMNVDATRTSLSRGYLPPGWIAQWQGRRKDLAPGQTAQFNAGRDAVNQYNNSLNAQHNAVDLGPVNPSLKGYVKDLITHEYVAKQKRVSAGMGGSWDTSVPAPDAPHSFRGSNYNPPPPENFPEWLDTVPNPEQRAQAAAQVDQPATVQAPTTQPVSPATAQRVSDVRNDDVLSDEEMLAEYGAPPDDIPPGLDGGGQPPVNTPPVTTAAPQPERPTRKVVTAQASPSTATGRTVARVDDLAVATEKAEAAFKVLQDEFPEFIRDHFGRDKSNAPRFNAWRDSLEPARKQRFEENWSAFHAQRPLVNQYNRGKPADQKVQSVFTKMVDQYGWKGDPDHQPNEQERQAFFSEVASTSTTAASTVVENASPNGSSGSSASALASTPVVSAPVSDAGNPVKNRSDLLADAVELVENHAASNGASVNKVQAYAVARASGLSVTPEMTAQQIFEQLQAAYNTPAPARAATPQEAPAPTTPQRSRLLMGTSAGTAAPSINFDFVPPDDGSNGGGNPPNNGSNPPMDPKRARQIMMSNRAYVGGVAHGLLTDKNIRDFVATQSAPFQQAFDVLNNEMWDALAHSRPSVISGMMSDIRANRTYLRRDEAADLIPTSVRMSEAEREYGAEAQREVLSGVPPTWTRAGDRYEWEEEADALNRGISAETQNGALPETGRNRVQRMDFARGMLSGITPSRALMDKNHSMWGEYKDTGNHFVDPSTGEVSISSDMINRVASAYQGARNAATNSPIDSSLSNKEVAATIHARMGEMLKASLNQYEQEIAKTEPDKARVAELRKKMDMISKAFELEADNALEAAFGAGGFKDLNYGSKRARGKALQQYMDNPDVAAKVEQLGGFEKVSTGDLQVIQAGELALEVGADAPKTGGYNGFASKKDYLGSIYQTTLGHLMMAQFMGSMAWKATGGSVLDAANQYGISQYSYVGMANFGAGDPTGATMYAARQELAADRFGEQAYAQYGMFNELGYVASNLPGGAGQFAVRGMNDLKMAGGLGLAAGVGTWGLGSLMTGVGATMTAGGLAAGAGVTAAAGVVAGAAAPIGLAVGATALAGLGSMNLYNSLTGQDPYEGASVKNWLGGQVLGMAEAGRNPLQHAATSIIAPIRGIVMGDASYQEDYTKKYYGTSVEDYVKASPIARLIGEKNIDWLYEDRDPQTVKLKKLVDNLSDDTGFRPDEIAGNIKAIQMAFGGIETDKDQLGAKFFVKQMADQGLSVEAGLSAVDQLAGFRGLHAGTEEYQNLALQYANLPSAVEKQKYLHQASRDFQRYSQWMPYIDGGAAQAYQLYTDLGGANASQTQAIQSIFAQAQMSGANLTEGTTRMLTSLTRGQDPYQTMDLARMSGSLAEMGVGNFSANFTDLSYALGRSEFGFHRTGAGAVSDVGNIIREGGNKSDTLAFIKGVTGGNQYALADYGRMAGIGSLQMVDAQGLQTGLKDMSGLLMFANQDILKKEGLTGAQTLSGLGMSFGSTDRNALLSGGLWAYQQSYVDQTNSLQAQSLGLQFTELANNRRFMYAGWGIEDQQTQEQWSSQLRNFDYQSTMMDTQRRHRLEDAEYTRQQRGLSTENSRWTHAFDYQTSLMRRDWAREDYQFNTQMRQLSFGWNMEDMDEQIRRSSGYERSLLIRQRDRANLSNNLQSQQAETQQGRQEQLWAREDERFKKSLEFNEQMIQLDENRFEMNQRQAEEIYLLQKAHLGEEIESATKLHELRLEMEALQRERQQEQLRQSEASLNIQKQMMNLQNEYANNMTVMSHTQTEMEATLRKITSYSPAFSRMLTEFLTFLEHSSTLKAPTAGGSITYR